MENLAPVILLLMILASVISEVRAQSKGTASPSRSKKKRTWMDYGRNLINQIEALDQGKSSSKPVPPKYTEEKPRISGAKQLDPLRVDLDVQTDSQKRQPDQMVTIPDQNRVQKKVFLEEKRKPKVNLTLKRRLNKTGLRQSIIMAEVLGAPRSKRPYSPPRH